jgi:heme/copper-type cytochrome/quinol oxidase subunit 3
VRTAAFVCSAGAVLAALLTAMIAHQVRNDRQLVVEEARRQAAAGAAAYATARSDADSARAVLASREAAYDREINGTSNQPGAGPRADRLATALEDGRKQADSAAARAEQAGNAVAAADDRFRAAVHRADQVVVIAVWIMISIAVMVAFVYAYVVYEQRRVFEDDEATARLREEHEDSFNTEHLWRTNRHALVEYHAMVRRYAASSRQLTLFTLLSGFVFLMAVGAAALLLPRTTALAITASVVAAAGAAVTGFIGNAVLRNSETSSREVLAFFSHPLEVERLLTAERIVHGMSAETRDAAKLLIVGALTRSAAPPPGSAPEANGTPADPS